MIQRTYTPVKPFSSLFRQAGLPRSLARFGGTESASPTQNPPKISRLLKHFDFTDLGNSHVKQIQLVYAACILWRLIAANERRKASPTHSWNEIRESILRDSVGYTFWFFGTPMLQRLYLATIPQAYRKALIQKNPQTAETGSLWKQAKTLFKQWNPISGYAILSSEQVNDIKAQAVLRLKEKSLESSNADYQRIEKFFNKLIMHRNIATGIGLVSTILLLGIGLNFLNFYLTRKNMEHRNKAPQKPEFPPAPKLPDIQAPALFNPAIHTPPASPFTLPVTFPAPGVGTLKS